MADAEHAASELGRAINLRALRSYILQRTNNLNNIAAFNRWQVTREYLAAYHPNLDANNIIAWFEYGGAHDDLLACYWVERYA